MVTIKESFTGYPDGSKGKKRLFKAGEEPKDLPPKFEELIVRKGHAEYPAKAKKGSEAK